MPTASRTNAPATGRWGRIPAWWLDHPDLDADGLAVLAALATYADEDGVCWPSQATLAGKLKRSRPTVNRILQRLGEIGLVAIERRSGRDGARLSCRYRLRFTDTGDGSPPDRDDSVTDTPCPAASQQQHQPEQIPDSPTPRAPHPDRRNADRSIAETCVTETWMPDPDDRLWAQDRFPDLDVDAHAEAFVLRCRAHGYRYRDIGAAWRGWLVQDAAAGKVPSRSRTPSVAPSSHARGTVVEQRVTAWMAAAAHLQAVHPLHPQF